MKKFALITFALMVGVVAALLTAYYYSVPLFEDIEAKTYDYRFRLRGSLPKSKDIAIIAIDDASIKELGRFPWSRVNYVPLIDNITKAGAKALLMDAFFPEAESKKADKAFAAAMERSGRVVLATAFNLNDYGVPVGQTVSIPELSEAAIATAHINFLPDSDGTNRWSLLVAEFEDNVYPSLGMLGAMIALNTPTFEAGEHFVTIGDLRHIVTDDYNRMLVNHTGMPGETYENFSFADVAKGRVPPEKLQGKILYLGATALGIYDMRISPFYPDMPGVEINANVADNIIQGNYMSRGGFEALLDMAAIVVLALLAYALSLKLKPLTSLPLVSAVGAGYLGLTYYMFLNHSWLNIVYPILALALTYMLTWTSRYLLLDKTAREMRSMFSSYVSPKVVEQLVLHPEAAQIGGDTRQITIMFSDVKGYTSYSESKPPKDVVKTLNEYLGAMSTIIMAHEGTLDKFLGDGIMAYWGAPLPQEGHAEQALECTRAMFEEMRRLQAKWAQEGTEPFSIRIGVNSGEVVAGNIGAEGKKMEYTVIGDTVNLASRLEGTAKAYGASVLVSQNTHALTKDQYLFREIDAIRVVGKKQPIRCYELLGRRDAMPEAEAAALLARAAEYERGLALYRQRDWDGATAVFKSLVEANASDAASVLFINRCDIFKRFPPPEGWDGVFDRRDK